MADLKQGTTVGGNSIWTQGNLPLVPAGNFLSYRGFKVYTENDKPTATDLGFLPAAGGVLTGAVTSNSAITTTNTMTAATLYSTYRASIIRGGGESAYPYLTIVNTDLNGSSPPASTQTIGAVFFREASQTADPFVGIIRANISTTMTSTGGVVTFIDNRDSSGAVQNRIQLNSDTNTTTFSQHMAVQGTTTLAGTTNAANLTTSGTITSTGRITTSAGLAINTANAGIELGSLSAVGTPYIDFHTTGTNTDYDIRLTANTTAVSILSTNSLTNFNMETVQSLNLHTSATSQIKMSRGCVVIRDYYNGNVSISAVKRNDSDTIGGELYLGYTNATTGAYTNTVRLESAMTWKGAKTLIDANGNIIAGNLDTNYLPLTGGAISGIATFTRENGSIEFSIAGKDALRFNYSTAGNFGLWNFTTSTWSLYKELTGNRWIVNEAGGLNVTAGGYLSFLPHQFTGRYGAGLFRDHGNGNVTISASTTSAGATTGGALHLGYNGTNHYTSSVRIESPLIITSSTTASGTIVTSGEFITTLGVYRSRAPSTTTNAHLYFENPNGTERGILWVTPDGVMNVRSAANQFSVQGSLFASTAITSAGSVMAGNGSAIMTGDGNIYGSIWGNNYLSNYLNNFTIKTQVWNDVGSYIYARYGGAAVGVSQQVSGSQLFPAAGEGSYDSAVTAGGGTWICCGRSITNSDTHRSTVWRRIA